MMMRSIRIPAAIVLMLSCLSNTLRAQDIILSDFNSKGLAFTYGSWNQSGTLVIGSSYLTVQSPATPQGGGGENLSSLSLNPANYQVSLTAKVGPNNQADYINVVLLDQDDAGYEGYVYFFPVSNFNSTAFTTAHVPLLSWGCLNNPQDSALNFDTGGKGLIGWQIQGNYANNTDTFNYEIDHLQRTLIPEPGFLGLAVGGVGSFLLLRLVRRR